MCIAMSRIHLCKNIKIPIFGLCPFRLGQNRPWHWNLNTQIPTSWAYSSWTGMDMTFALSYTPISVSGVNNLTIWSGCIRCNIFYMLCRNTLHLCYMLPYDMDVCGWRGKTDASGKCLIMNMYCCFIGVQCYNISNYLAWRSAR